MVLIRLFKISRCWVVSINKCRSRDSGFESRISLYCAFHLFVCLFGLTFYGPVNQLGSCQALSVYVTTFLLGMLSPLSTLNQYCALSFTRNWQLHSRREKMTIENISWSNIQPPDLQSDAHTAELPRPAHSLSLSPFLCPYILQYSTLCSIWPGSTLFAQVLLS